MCGFGYVALTTRVYLVLAEEGPPGVTASFGATRIFVGTLGRIHFHFAKALV